MALYSTANINERLNAGVYAPLAGIAKPMVEPVLDIDPSLMNGQGVNVSNSGVATLASNNATHIIVGSHINFIDGTYKQWDEAKSIPAVNIGQALVDVMVKDGETLVIGDSVTFVNGLLQKRTSETQYFIVEDTETVGTTITARIKFIAK